MAEKQPTPIKEEPWDNLRKIKAFSRQPNALLDKQQITEKASLMYPVYEHALRALQNVMASSRKWVEESEESHNKDFYGYGNNVIAFCAPRGQGKTSAMLSLSNALKNSSKSTQHQDEDGVNLWWNTIERKAFHVMPPIDPTVLDGKESVVNLVLAWLFQEINEAWKRCKDSPEHIEKDKLELLKHFQKCRECLARHNGTKDADFSDLIKKSVIFEIKKHLYEIIKCYFQVCGISKSGIENYLIIQLDDTDMDMVNAYDVLEDVRKFLSLPQTIVLMATYLRQLRMLVAKHYEDVLPLPHGNKGENQHPINYMQMAAKYIDKLIPAQQMIHIGSFRNLRDLNGKVSINSFLEHNSNEDEANQTGKKGNNFEKESDIEDDLEKEFFALIQAKTGLAFERHSTYVNNILPTTLRGLVHLFQLLEKMDTPKQHDVDGFQAKNDDLKLQQRNLIAFEDYFRNDWCYSNLVETDQEIMWKISQAHTAPKLRIIRNISIERWKWAGDWWTNRAPSPSIIFSDIILLLKEAEHRAESMNDLLLIFAIKTHLDILSKKLKLFDELNNNEGIEDNEPERQIGSLRWQDYSQLKSFINCEVQGDLNLSLDSIRELLNVLANEESKFSDRPRKKKLLKDISDRIEAEKPRCVFVLLNKETIETLKNSIDEHDDFSDEGEEYKEKVIEQLSDLYECISKESLDTIVSNRIALLCELLFNRNFYESAKEGVAEVLCSDKEYHQNCFQLQESVFKILGNHDVLRLWLSNDPKRFAKCKKYVWEDPSNSVKTALDNVYTKLNPPGSASTGDNSAQGVPQQDEVQFINSQAESD